MAEQTINIPQIIAVVLVGFFAIRWFLSSSSSTQSSSRNAGRQINPAHVDQVMSMFPQLDRRTVMWDLQRNGGSVQATTERVLSGRSLDTPPPSFQPQITQSATQTLPATRPTSSTDAPLPDLITRYNLSSKISSSSGVDPGTASDSSPSPSASGSKAGWSQNKSERAELLKKRREDMILAARRKMEAKEKQTS
ncbi:hypothetical protein MBLNU457_3491t1 [Dothideomycetes sp. NU457]